MPPLDVDLCLEHLFRGEILHEMMVRDICQRMKEIYAKEPNVITVNAPVTIVGDIHG